MSSAMMREPMPERSCRCSTLFHQRSPWFFTMAGSSTKTRVEVPIRSRSVSLPTAAAGATGAKNSQPGNTVASRCELLTHVEKDSATRNAYSHLEATVFPGWEFFAPVAPAAAVGKLTLLDLMGTSTRVFVEEPAMVKNQGERWWNKVEQRHERSGIGSLIMAEDIYLSPWELEDRLRDLSHKAPAVSLDQLGAVDVLDAANSELSEIGFASRPTQRFHGSIPAMVDAIRALVEQDARVVIAAPNQGEVERLASLLQEYQLAYRLGVPLRPDWARR